MKPIKYLFPFLLIVISSYQITLSGNLQWTTAYFSSYSQLREGEQRNPDCRPKASLKPSQIDWTCFTHMNYFGVGVTTLNLSNLTFDGFNVVINPSGSVTLQNDSGITDAECTNSITKINDITSGTFGAQLHGPKPLLITVGGGSNTNFGVLVNSGNTANLITNIVAFMKYFQFDGVDCDYEVKIDGTNQSKFTTFIGALYSALQLVPSGWNTHQTAG